MDGFASTPDNTMELAEITRAIFVGTAGDVAIVLASNTELLFKNVGAGSILPIRAHFIKATGTSAGNLLGLV